MKKAAVEFATVTKNGIVRVGRSSILQPKTNFKGNPDSIKWYPDRPKKKTTNKNGRVVL